MSKLTDALATSFRWVHDNPFLAFALFLTALSLGMFAYDQYEIADLRGEIEIQNRIIEAQRPKCDTLR